MAPHSNVKNYKLLRLHSGNRGTTSPSALKGCWQDVKGLRIHSRSAKVAGGIPFVLIHGLIISSLYMIPLAERLAVRHEVHALDLPGFGRSESPSRVLSISQLADAVVDWLAASEIRRCYLVANSLGCEVAAHVALKAPSEVVSLVLIGPTLDPNAHAFLTQTFRLFWDALHEPVRLWFNWAVDFFRAGLRRALGTTREMFRDHIEHQLPKIVVPALIMRGGIDPTCPQVAAEEMVRLLRGSQLLVIESEPHCVHYTAPSVVGDAIEGFVALLQTKGA